MPALNATAGAGRRCCDSDGGGCCHEATTACGAREGCCSESAAKPAREGVSTLLTTPRTTLRRPLLFTISSTIVTRVAETSVARVTASSRSNGGGHGEEATNPSGERVETRRRVYIQATCQRKQRPQGVGKVQRRTSACLPLNTHPHVVPPTDTCVHRGFLAPVARGLLRRWMW